MYFANLGQLSNWFSRAMTNCASANESLALRISESVTLFRSLVSGLPGKRGWYRLIHRVASGSPDLKALMRSFACSLYCSNLGRADSFLSPFIIKLLSSPGDQSRLLQL